MHILLLPSWYPTKPEDVKGVFFRDQALALARSGHKVGVIAPELKSLRMLVAGRGNRPAPEFEVDEGLATYRKEVLAALPKLPYGNYLLLRRAAIRLFSQYIRSHGRPDIIHAHVAVFGGAIATTLGRKFGVPVVLTEHSSGFARHLYYGWQLRLAAKAFAQASSLMAVSPALGQLLAQSFPALAVKWKWIPNVVSNRFVRIRTNGTQRRSVRFLNLALMTENKGQFDLLRAFSYLRDKGLKAELWLAGDGTARVGLEKLAHDLGIENAVSFLGVVDPSQVPDLMSNVDVLVLSSHYETFGVVAAEALTAGLPVVATRCGGPECIVEEGDGVLVPVKQPRALAAGMESVALNLDAYDRRKIQERAQSRFSPQAVARLLEQEYSRVINATSTYRDSR